MIVYPAIDLKGGRCVRLTQGRADRETVYTPATCPTSRSAYQAAGSSWVHVVDLDGAFGGEPKNLAAIQAIVGVGLKVQCGGGLRTRAAVERLLGLGVCRAIIGTIAAENAAFVGELVQAFGEKIAVGIDAKDGWVAVRGWVGATGIGALDLARRMDETGVATIIHTDIGTDGMLSGPNVPAQEAMLGAVKCRVIASGGVGRREDIVRLSDLARRNPRLDGVIVGKALYEGQVDLGDILKLSA